VAGQFRDRPETVYFELLNEPHGKLTEEIWNGLLVEALGVVRESNPERMVIVGPGRWNNPAQLPSLVLPGGDRSLIVTFHYYGPFEFTHQGASWVGANPPPLGRRWTGSAEERAAVGRDFAAAAAWAKAAGRPLYVGEFGAYEKADMGSRALWTRVVREEAEKHGMSWAYWEFGSGFGAYDRGVGAWREPLLDALVGK
jgi:endoglucanase